MNIWHEQVDFETYLLTERRVSVNTLTAYRTDIRQFARYCHERGITLSGVTGQTLRDFLATFVEHSLSARSAARKVSSLKRFFSYLRARGVTKNHAAGLVFPKIERKLPTCLSEREVESLLRAAAQDSSMRGMRNAMILELLYVAGLRISEMIALTLGDVNFESGTLTVRGKGGRERIIPLPLAFLPRLREYITMLGLYSPCYARRDPLLHLFGRFSAHAPATGALSRQFVWVMLKNLVRAAGIRARVSPHTLRHSLATHLLKRGAGLRSLQVLLGHQSIATVQLYTHVEVSYLRSIYDKKHPRS